jgi:hypothetical protein
MVSLKKRFESNSRLTASHSRKQEPVCSSRERHLPALIKVGRVLWVLLFGVVGCDVPPGAQTDEIQWDISSSPKAGAQGVKRFGPIWIEFDRRILPHSLQTGSLELKSGEVRTRYQTLLDPVSRTIHLQLNSRFPLEPEVTYRLAVDSLTDLDGVSQDEPYEIYFRTGTELGEAESIPQVDWPTVEPVFSASCALATCHGSKSPVLGLNLSSAAGVAQTAIGARSRQLPSDLISAEGARGALSLAGLRIIEAQWGVGQSASSYLMYKVLRDPHILGDSMPPPDSSVQPLSKRELTALSHWILSGAPTDN